MKKDLIVETHKEKRTHQRYEHSSPMSLHRMDYQDQCYYAEMCDYSQAGLSLLTNEKLVIGHFIYLEMKSHNKSVTSPEKYKSYSGSVKWASHHSSLNGDDKGPYRYGVEYSELVRPSLN